MTLYFVNYFLIHFCRSHSARTKIWCVVSITFLVILHDSHKKQFDFFYRDKTEQRVLWVVFNFRTHHNIVSTLVLNQTSFERCLTYFGWTRFTFVFLTAPILSWNSFQLLKHKIQKAYFIIMAFSELCFQSERACFHYFLLNNFKVCSRVFICNLVSIKFWVIALWPDYWIFLIWKGLK